jgi:hypothetical protein
MIKWRDLSFPHRTIALVVVFLCLLFVVYFNRVAYGSVTLSSQQVNAYAYSRLDSRVHALPYTFRVKPQKVKFVVGAPGYEEQEILIKVLAFRTVSQEVNLTPLPQGTNDDHPQLDAQIPRQTAEYSITRQSDGVYVITLFAVLNRPSQYSLYQSQLDTYGQLALDWIKNQGQDPQKLTIIWEPEKPTKISVGKSR